MSDEDELRCHGSCNAGQQGINSLSQGWQVLSRPQTQCSISHHRPLRHSEATSLFDFERAFSHIEALKIIQNNLRNGHNMEPTTIIFDAAARAAYRVIASEWERAHSRILNLTPSGPSGFVATPVVNDASAVIAYCKETQFVTGVFGFRLFDTEGNQISREIEVEIPLEYSEGNDLAAILATAGLCAAVRLARSIVSAGASAFVRGSVLRAAYGLLASVVRIGRGIFAWGGGRGGALARLERTAANLLNHEVTRRAYVLTTPEIFRHTLTGQLPKGFYYAQIERSAALRLSTASSAHYGEGVYAWARGATGVRKWIDFEASAGTAVESLAVKNALTGQTQTFFRLVPATGESLPIRIVGSNLTPEEIALGREWALGLQ